ncbi:hypothetical protein LCGC14_0372360 [marine sediment metagenome]|uniref:Uncharacterized protein n=1 Tax=marine sediment metagenome TaxID=412755 RepID=A0A0F9T4T1_9ZZZZ
MKVIIADSSNMILCNIYDDSIRIPIKGDYVCYRRNIGAQLIRQDLRAEEGIVEKVMLDYVQDIAIVTVKET